MRSPKEIAAEMDALKALKPTGVHARATRVKILAAIEELEFGVDDTADEWREMSAGARDIVLSARDWKNGVSEDKASQGWGQLVE